MKTKKSKQTISLGEQFMNSNWTNRLFLPVILYNFLVSRKSFMEQKEALLDAVNAQNSILSNYLVKNKFSVDRFDRIYSTQAIDKNLSYDERDRVIVETFVSKINEITASEGLLNAVTIKRQHISESLVTILVIPAMYDNYYRNVIDLVICSVISLIGLLIFY